MIRAKLPFNPEDDDDTIIKALMGRRIIWVTPTCDEPRSDRMGNNNRDSKHCRVKRNGRDYVEFVGAYGFRSVYLDQIVQVR